MTKTSRTNLYLGLSCAVFAILLLFVWIPLDTGSGIVEKMRGRYQIGDALAPTVAAFFILMGGILLMLREVRAQEQPTITRAHLSFIVRLCGVLFLSLLIMRHLGPLTVELFNWFRVEALEYRLLRATVPWKYIGFVVGGITLITGSVAVVEGRLSRRVILIAIGVVLALIIIYDLPFEDLLLPPNGDV